MVEGGRRRHLLVAAETWRPWFEVLDTEEESYSGVCWEVISYLSAWNALFDENISDPPAPVGLAQFHIRNSKPHAIS